MTSSHSRSAHVISVIDSDYDEDDEYNQCEIDEIFSISPTGEECCDFDPAKEDCGSEFDSEEIITPGCHGVSALCDNDLDDADEDEDDLEEHDIDIKN